MNDALKSMNAAAERVDEQLRHIMSQRASRMSPRLYDMLRYSLGFLDTDMKETLLSEGGKRLRPALCLLLARGYGVEDNVMPAALAIELFHNFTLIHDDVEDRDEIRRGKPTLWKLFGVNHAINAGDMLGLLANEMCTEAGPHLCGPLQRAFEEVIVGQFYDFELSHEPIHEHVVSDTRYMLMTEKKTGALMGISAEAGGILAHVETKERTNLRDFGRLLGVAFQIADDYASVWSTHEETHKDEHSDIREKKRTLPFLIAYAEVMKKDRLRELYSLDRQLTEDERIEVKTIIDTTPAQGRVIREISLYADRAAEVVQSLSIPDDMKASLAAYAHSLVPTQGAA